MPSTTVFYVEYRCDGPGETWRYFGSYSVLRVARDMILEEKKYDQLDGNAYGYKYRIVNRTTTTTDEVVE
jgi:hypothetical protein